MQPCTLPERRIAKFQVEDQNRRVGTVVLVFLGTIVGVYVLSYPAKRARNYLLGGFS
jgi:hypothetical protein